MLITAMLVTDSAIAKARDFPTLEEDEVFILLLPLCDNFLSRTFIKKN